MSFLDGIWHLYDRMFTKKDINFSTLRNQNTKKIKSHLGDGGYGIIYENHTKPTNYTRRKGAFKLYFNQPPMLQANPNANYNTARKIANITGNNNQRLQVVKGYKKSDLPNNVIKRLEDIGKMPTSNNANLPVVRMPYLGINLEVATEPGNIASLHKLPISILIIQCYELMKQIDKIRKKRMCHHDIKINNIMIHPESGKMTLIDFDLFGNFELGFQINFGKVDSIREHLSECIPPEFICIRAIRDTIVRNRENNIQNSKTERIRIFSDDMFLKYMNGGIFQFLESINKNEKTGKKYFVESFKSNISLLDDVFKEGINFDRKVFPDRKTINYFMNYFDYYGFGMAMTIFFSRLYPMNKPYDNRSEMAAFHEMRALLMSMCDFSRANRPEPDTIVKIMEEIILRNSVSMNQTPSISVANNQAPSIPNVANHTTRVPTMAIRAPRTPRKK